MVEVRLTNGGAAVVDFDDVHLVIDLKWARRDEPTGQSYAVAYVGQTDSPNARRGKRPLYVFMHRLLLGLGRGGPLVDHVDGDGLNNRRSNLRLATKSQNAANGKAHRDGRSRFKGVHPHSQTDRWVVQCGHRHVGLFDDEVEAAVAYDMAALERYGEFARTNFEVDR